MRSDTDRWSPQRWSAIDDELGQGDPIGAGVDDRVAYYRTRANEAITAAGQAVDDPQRRAWAEDMATEALYRARALTRDSSRQTSRGRNST
jgi:hypothetical protein